VRHAVLKTIAAFLNTEGGDFFVRSGPSTVKLPMDSANEYIRTRFPGYARPADSPSKGAV
jgi:hypothetical protein